MLSLQKWTSRLTAISHTVITLFSPWLHFSKGTKFSLYSTCQRLIQSQQGDPCSNIHPYCGLKPEKCKFVCVKADLQFPHPQTDTLELLCLSWACQNNRDVEKAGMFTASLWNQIQAALSASALWKQQTEWLTPSKLLWFMAEMSIEKPLRCLFDLFTQVSANIIIEHIQICNSWFFLFILLLFLRAESNWN